MSDQKQFAHAVYFTLKEKNAEQQEKLVEACHKYLTDHPGAVHYSAGARAANWQRPVNDQEFDVALLLVFASEAGHDQYQTSERHKQFLAEMGECWSKVRVFDALV